MNLFNHYNTGSCCGSLSPAETSCCSSCCNSNSECSCNVGSVQNTVFLNKIFYENTGASCPIIYSLTANDTNFKQQLDIGGSVSNCNFHHHCNCNNGCNNNCGCNNGCNNNCGCGCNISCSCCNFQVTPTSTFTVTNSAVAITGIQPVGTISESDVTVDGYPVSQITNENGIFIADLGGILSELSNCPFFLAEIDGPWEVYLTIVLEGTVSNGSQTCRFRLVYKTTETTSGSEPIIVSGDDNFALCNLTIPCQTQGMAPQILFDFTGCATLLNPTIEVEPTCPCTSPSLVLTANLILTPSIHLQVIRPTLFALNASELTTECDNEDEPELCSCCQSKASCCGQTSCCDQDNSCCHHQNSCCDQDNSCCHHQNSCCDQDNSCCEESFPACQCCDTNGYRF